MCPLIRDGKSSIPLLRPFRGVEIMFPLLTSRSFIYKDDDIFSSVASDESYRVKEVRRALATIINALKETDAEITGFRSFDGWKPRGFILEFKNAVIDVDVKYKKTTVNLHIEIKMYGTDVAKTVDYLAYHIIEALKNKGFPK